VVAVVVGCSPSPALKWPLWTMGLGECAVVRHHLLPLGGTQFAEFGFVPVDHQQILHSVTPFDRLDRRHPVERGNGKTTSSG